ncbi:MAG: hypothetical protein HOO99_07270 [Hyphomicrobiaceae bacterium]|nr:hypothetical protein [Hyphomicrobiaceae bacterium]
MTTPSCNSTSAKPNAPPRQKASICSVSLSIGLSAFVLAFINHLPAIAQETGMRPGEAFLTRFSGIKPAEGAGETGPFVIASEGIVGSIIDLRAPGRPPQGSHWIDEPQRAFVTAADVGQVFGVVLDEQSPPNIYITATAAFGLHTATGSRRWMDGMWGRRGGPGTIYKLDRSNGYKPTLFTDVKLSGRANTGAALGNIAFDKVNRQFFVSDLETGMIHRIAAVDGADRGHYDHGVQGRARFLDVPTKQQQSLTPIAFDPASRARLEDCPTGRFDQTPECWNLAAAGRRVWGVGVWHEPGRGESRLFYAIWSGPGQSGGDWANRSEEDKRSSVWSVGIRQDGALDPNDIRRELILPDFFVSDSDIKRAGYSQPVSDISFTGCGERPVMLLAERGGLRNLGLGEEAAFSKPHEARALRYELDRSGAWRPVGRYDVGYYDRSEEGQPHVRANCSGGVAFGPGYDEKTWTADTTKRDQYVWISGHALCAPKAPCNLPGFGQELAESVPTSGDTKSASGTPPATPAAVEGDPGGPDDSEVHGIAGMAETAFEEVAPTAAYRPYPTDTQAAYPATGPDRAYLVDADINVDARGALIETEITRNDATRIGDIVIYQPCPPPRTAGIAIPTGLLLTPPLAEDPPMTWVDHPSDISHARVASHGRFSSHSRYGSHSPYWSHSRFNSHSTFWSHSRTASHNPIWSHNRLASHSRERSHSLTSSHTRVSSHFRIGSHSQEGSHNRLRSHNPSISHAATASHNRTLSHTRLFSHSVALSHVRLSSHATALSHSLKGSHSTVVSHKGSSSHNLSLSHGRTQSHSRSISHTITGSHAAAVSHGPKTSHATLISKGGQHTLVKSHSVEGSGGHGVVLSKGPQHAVVLSKGQTHSILHSKGTVHQASISTAVAVGGAVAIIGATKGAGGHVRAISALQSLPQGLPKTQTGNPLTNGGAPVVVPKTGQPIVVKPKIDLPKVITPKIDPPKVIRPKVDTPKVTTTKVDPTKVIRPKVDTPKVIRPKVDTQKRPVQKVQQKATVKPVVKKKDGPQDRKN